MSIVRPVIAFNTPVWNRVVSAHRDWLPELHPLVSYAFIDASDKERVWNAPFASWMLDSGAYTAFTSGVRIQLPDYIRECKRRMMDPRLTDIIALDVIGDWRASLRNTELMWKAGIKAIPVYHHEEPWDVLKGLARDYPMVAVGGFTKGVLKPVHKRLEYCAEVFSRIWPAKIHGLGFTSREIQTRFPFWSVDAATWVNPMRFGTYRSFGYGLKTKGNRHDRCDIDLFYFIKLQRLLQAQWKTELSRFLPARAA